MFWLWLIACGDKTENTEEVLYEGDDASECSDGADNDRDGLFDCEDDGCAGSPDCQEDTTDTTDTNDTTDTVDTGDTTDTGNTTDTGDTTEAPQCNPGSGQSIPAVNMPYHITGASTGSTPIPDLAGWSLAMCDIDNDGFDDLAVGVPYAGGGPGRVAVYYGPGTLWSSVMDTSGNFADAYFTSDGSAGFLGHSLACGDLNGDGADELVMGVGQGTVFGASVNAGIRVFFNTGTKWTGQVDVANADVSLFYNTGYNGTSGHWPLFWTADTDNDGMDEVLYFMNKNSFYGTAAGDADNKVWILDVDQPSTGNMESHKSFSIIPADIDGVTDIQQVGNRLVVGQGAHTASTSLAGKVSILSTPITENMSLTTQAQATLTGTGTQGFGSALAIDDFNQDGVADMVVGAVGSGGAIHTYYQDLASFSGSVGGPSQADSTLVSSFNTIGVGQRVQSMGDINGDGFPELLVTALGEYSSGDTGKAYIVDGLCLDGTTSSVAPASLYQFTAQGANDRFGWASAVGDINGDGRQDMAISAPYFMPDPNVGLQYGAEGRVYIWFGPTE